MTSFKRRTALVVGPVVLLLLLLSCGPKEIATPVPTAPAPTPVVVTSVPQPVVMPTPAPAVATPAPVLPTPAATVNPTPVVTAAPLPTQAPSLLEETPYANNALGFSIRSPRGWLKDDSGTANTLVVFGSPQPDTDGGQPFTANINIITDSMRGMAFGDYVQLTRQLIPKQVPGSQISGDKRVPTGPGTGQLLEWSMPVPQAGLILKVLTLLAPSLESKGGVLVVTFTALESTWSKYQDVAQAALLSLRMTTPAPLPDLLEFTNKLPPISRVTYTVPEGEKVTVPAFGGWVSLVSARGVTPYQVVWAAASVGGKMVEANARLGLYTLSVAEGEEGRLIARLRQEPWVVEASPVFLVGRTQKGDKPVKVVDYPFDPGEKAVGNPCEDSHGNLTALQITRAGQNAEIVDVRNRKAIKDTEQANIAGFAWYFDTGNKILEAMNTGSVVNASLGARSKIPVKVKDRLGETTFDYKLVGAEYKHAQAAFLAMVFRVAEEGPDVPVVISAGNGDALDKGQDLTRYMEALRKQFPNAGRRVRLAEAWWTNPKTGVWERAPWSDYSSVGSIAAPGVEVPIETTGVKGLPGGTVKCNGTSFAAPVVTAMMDSMRKAAPDKSAGELWVRFERVTQKKLGEDWSKTGLSNRLVREAAGKGVATVQLEPPAATIQAGENQAFKAIVKDASGAVITDLPASAFSWSSSSLAIATVNNSGSVAGKATGKVEITVSIEGVTGKASLTVAAARPDLTVTAVSFSPASGRVGDTLFVTFTIKNVGDAELGSFSNRVSLATTRYGTNYSLGNFSMESLAPQTSRTATIKTSAIESTVAEGSYWVTVFTDGFQRISESDENNNVGSSETNQFTLRGAVAETWTGNLTGSGKWGGSIGDAEYSLALTVELTYSDGLVDAYLGTSSNRMGFPTGKATIGGTYTVTRWTLTDYGKKYYPNAMVSGGPVANGEVGVDIRSDLKQIWLLKEVGDLTMTFGRYSEPKGGVNNPGYQGRGVALIVENVTPTTITGRWYFGSAKYSTVADSSPSYRFTLTKAQ